MKELTKELQKLKELTDNFALMNKAALVYEESVRVNLITSHMEFHRHLIVEMRSESKIFLDLKARLT